MEPAAYPDCRARGTLGLSLFILLRNSLVRSPLISSASLIGSISGEIDDFDFMIMGEKIGFINISAEKGKK